MADIPAKLVKELREKTGAGMMDCKKALNEVDGDIEKAVEWLRQKGIASAEKKAGKVAAEGLVDSYIHTGGRIGVLVEVNCQTDFVARNEDFQALVRNIAMQIAACPNVEYVSVDDIPQDIVEKEKAVEMGRDDLANKPENIREKIVLGRIEKRLKELSLLDQPYIRDQSITVDELVKQSAGQLGENIQVRRFVRFVLGEGIEKEETDFAAEVAAQTAALNKKSEPEAAELKEEVAEEAEKEEVPAKPAEAVEAEVTEAEVTEAEPSKPDDSPEAETPDAKAPDAEAPKAASKPAKPSKKSSGGSKKKKK